MSKGIFSALEYVENLIELTTPKSDVHHGFVAVNRGDGLTASLENRPHSNRYFELELEGLAQDDGQAGISGRKRSRVNLRVRYDIPSDQGYLMRLINEDVSYLIDTLKGPNYDTINTGIVSIIPLTPLLEPVLDAQGDALAFMLSLAFDLLYLEA